MRKFNRKYNELRQLKVQICEDHFAEGACIINLGKTSVLCSATIDSSVTKMVKNSNSGWITAEYSMLPRATQNVILGKLHQEKNLVDHPKFKD